MTKGEEYKRGGRGPTAAALQHHRGTTAAPPRSVSSASFMQSSLDHAEIIAIDIRLEDY